MGHGATGAFPHAPRTHASTHIREQRFLALNAGKCCWIWKQEPLVEMRFPRRDPENLRESAIRTSIAIQCVNRYLWWCVWRLLQEALLRTWRLASSFIPGRLACSLHGHFVFTNTGSPGALNLPTSSPPHEMVPASVHVVSLFTRHWGAGFLKFLLRFKFDLVHGRKRQKETGVSISVADIKLCKAVNVKRVFKYDLITFVLFAICI